MSGSEDIVVLYPRGGVAVAEFKGEHDVSSKQAVRELLGRLIDEHELIVADISDAQFIDSSIVSCLLAADKESRAQGKRFKLQLGTAPIVRRAIEITGALEILDHASTREEALNEVR